MKLLTYITLKNPAKDAVNGSPLTLQISDMEIVETEFNRDFIIHILPTLEWNAVLLAATSVGITGIPQNFSKELLQDEDLLKVMHNLLLDVQIDAGFLICTETGRKFTIENGIPCMLLN